jgi:hypothetical protein
VTLGERFDRVWWRLSSDIEMFVWVLTITAAAGLLFIFAAIIR